MAPKLSKYTLPQPHVKLSCGAVPGAACDALCCYGCGPKRKPTLWPKSEPTITLHLRYHLPSQLITLMACKGRAGIPHCPPLPLLMSAARPSYDGPQDGAFSCCWYPCIPLIRITAPGPAWEESMSPADLILLTHWLDSPCSAQPHPLREFGTAWVFRGRRSLLALKV
jgi:hypothetical protein